MAFYRYYQCDGCDGVFGFLHHPSNLPAPNYCPLCGVFVGEEMEPVFVAQAPHVAHTIGRTADQVYRKMEEASSQRAVVAAELGGGEASDYTALKIDDLADYLKPGDIAAKMPENPVGKFMSEAKVGGFIGMSGAEYAASTTQGAFPRRGEVMRQDVVLGHQERARMIESAGRISRTK